MLYSLYVASFSGRFEAISASYHFPMFPYIEHSNLYHLKQNRSVPINRVFVTQYRLYRRCSLIFSLGRLWSNVIFFFHSPKVITVVECRARWEKRKQEILLTHLNTCFFIKHVLHSLQNNYATNKSARYMIKTDKLEPFPSCFLESDWRITKFLETHFV